MNRMSQISSSLIGDVQSERANLYGMIGELLCEPPRAETIAGALSVLEVDRPPPQLATAHALVIRALRIAQDVDLAHDHEALFHSSGSPLGLRPCTKQSTTTIARVTRPAQDRIRHLLFVAMHADRCVIAMTDREAIEAVRAAQDSRELLMGHEGNCLFDFALRLQSCGRLFYEALGAALRELLDRDLAAFEAPGKPIKRWLALSVQQIHRDDGEVVLESLVRCPQHNGEAVSLDYCLECGRWDGMQYGGKEGVAMILCNAEPAINN